jgi:hypothetical protein
VVIHANTGAAEAEELCRSLRAENPNTWSIAAEDAQPQRPENGRFHYLQQHWPLT